MDHTSIIIDLLNQSHSPFHVVENLARLFQNSVANDHVHPGGEYVRTRNGSTFIAARLPEFPPKAIKIVATHNDSPTFKLKPNPVLAKKDIVCLNVEPYGGMIMHTWFDRPLSIAGRIVYEQGGEMKQALVDIDQDLLVIPSLCIHMDRNINKGHEYNPAKELIPVLAQGEFDGAAFENLVLKSAGVKSGKLLAHDLFLYVRQNAIRVGLNNEFLLSPRLDDLSSAYSAALAFKEAKSNPNMVEIFVSFDNEEVGSLTKQGAFGTVLKDFIAEILDAYHLNEAARNQVLANSFLFSVDNAHANHPNYPEISDPTTNVQLNRGIVVKYNANAKYTSDALSASYAKMIGQKAGVGVQEYSNRSDLPGGSTLGNLSNAQVSLSAADIGISQWAMHSCVETQGTEDLEAMVSFLKEFWEDSLLPLK